jgi:hypothetical protein
VLAVHVQRLPAGGQHPHAGRPGEQAGEHRGQAGHLLQVVGDQQQLGVGEVRGQRVGQLLAGHVVHLESGGQRADGLVGPGRVGQGHEDHPFGVRLGVLAGHRQRQLRLADAARPGQRDQPRLGEQCRHPAAFRLAADHVDRTAGSFTRRPGRAALPARAQPPARARP